MSLEGMSLINLISFGTKLEELKTHQLRKPHKPPLQDYSNTSLESHVPMSHLCPPQRSEELEAPPSLHLPSVKDSAVS